MSTAKDNKTPPGESQPKRVSAEEMREDLLRALYSKIDSLNGIALVNGLKAVAQLAQQEKAEPDTEDVKPHSLLEQIHALPPAHALKLLDVEIERLQGELDAHIEARDELKGT